MHPLARLAPPACLAAAAAGAALAASIVQATAYYVFAAGLLVAKT